jgi:salicylate hydroxylase
MVPRSATLELDDPGPAVGLARRKPDELVLIAGGGIGGLATALALAQHGIASHVFERRPAFAEDGAGIQIGPNGTKILASLGAADLLRSAAATPDAIRILDATSGRELVRLPLGRWIAARHGAPYWVAHRRDLHAALVARVRAEPLIEISLAAPISTTKSDAGSITARTEDGRSWTADAFIAADGLWSGLRTSLFRSRGLRYAGKCAVRAVVPIDAVPDGLHRTEVHLWLAPGAHVVHYPVRAGHEVAIVAIFDDPNETSDWSTPVAPQWVAHRATKFPARLRELLAQPETWRKWSLYTLRGRQRYTQGRAALLGDAAHPVLPFLAQGGVLALEDAVVIADCLARNPGDVRRALREYERRRRARVAQVTRASRFNGQIYHLAGILASLRNQALGTLPAERLMARYDWLYGWEGPLIES